MLRERWFTLRNETLAYQTYLKNEGFHATMLNVSYRVVVRWWETY